MDEGKLELIAPVKFVNAINKAYLEGLKDPLIETNDHGPCIVLKYNALFIDNERVDDLARKYKEKSSECKQQRTDDVD